MSDDRWIGSRIIERWNRGDMIVESTRYGSEDRFTSISTEGDDEVDFDKIGSVEDMAKAGFELVQTTTEPVELMPNFTGQQISKMITDGSYSGERLEKLIKMYTHVEKHSVYSRIRNYVDLSLKDDDMVLVFLDGKIETHREYAIKLYEELGLG